MSPNLRQVPTAPGLEAAQNYEGPKCPSRGHAHLDAHRCPGHSNEGFHFTALSKRQGRGQTWVSGRVTVRRMGGC